MSKYDVILTPEDVKRACEECPDDPAVSPTSYLYATERALALAVADVERLRSVTDDIRQIVAEYHRQSASGYVDTPGGLEHMGDVWRQLFEWDADLAAVDSEVSK